VLSIALEEVRPQEQLTTCGVVIPCHNYGRFLEEAFNSVLSQSRLPDEVVIVNDGSTDDTAEVADRLAEGRDWVRVIHRAVAGGAPNTFNLGVRATNTDYVVVLSADDRLSPNFLELSARLLNDGADAALSGLKRFGNTEGFQDPVPLDLSRVLITNHYHGSNLVRRSLFNEVGGYAENIVREDWDFWIAAIIAGAKGALAPDCWVEYRQHGPSRNQLSRFQAWRDRARIWRRHRKEIGLLRFAKAAMSILQIKALGR
jgi:glycosyltransferase involved in cell wall biosynthesis